MGFSYKPLFRLMLERDMKKTDLRHPPFGFGPSTIAKFDKGDNVSMEVLDKLCAGFGVQLNEIVEHKAGE